MSEQAEQVEVGVVEETISTDPMELARQIAATYGVRAVYRERGLDEDHPDMVFTRTRLVALWQVLQEGLHDMETGLVSAHGLISQLADGRIVCSKETGDMAEEWMKAFDERYKVVDDAPEE